MCGRYTITVTMDELIMRFMLDPEAVPYHQPRYNVAPGQMVMGIIGDNGNNRAGELKWGLIPTWANDEKIGFKSINARAETLMERPAFKVPFQRKRCIIPADSFYEWKEVGSVKQPMRIKLRSGDLFAMAGLYDSWIAPDGRKVSSCTIITTAPNELVGEIHDRMPVILPRDKEAFWLDRGQNDSVNLKELLKPYPAKEMIAYSVSAIVGNVKNDNPECIIPL